MSTPNLKVLIDSLTSDQKDSLYFKLEDFKAELDKDSKAEREVDAILTYIETQS